MKRMIEDLLALPNAKLYVIMNNNINATVSIERDIDTLEQFDNIFDLFNELLKQVTLIGKRAYIMLGESKYPIALAKMVNLSKGLSFRKNKKHTGIWAIKFKSFKKLCKNTKEERTKYEHEIRICRQK